MPTQGPLVEFAGATAIGTPDFDANFTAAASGALTYGAETTGGPLIYAVAIPLVLTQLVDGLVVSFIANITTTTGAPTLNINTLGPRYLCDLDGFVLGLAGLVGGRYYRFQMVTTSGSQHLRQI